MRKPMKRSLLLFTLLLLLAAGLTAEDAKNDVGSNFEVQKLADGVYAIVRSDPPGLMCDGNSLLIVNDDDVVVVDAPESTKQVVAALKKITNKPVRFVINTHWHDDHITGNDVWRKAYPGVEFVAHSASLDYLPTSGAENRRNMLKDAPDGVEMLRDLLAKGKSLSGGAISEEERASYRSDIELVGQYLALVPGTDYQLPTIAVSESLTLRRGSRTIEIRSLGRGHTAGDLVVWLPKERIVASGDLVIHPIPLVGSEQSYVGNWSATLGKLKALHPAIIVPGHGPVLRDDAYVTLMATLFDSIERQVGAAAAQGKTLDETRALVNLDDFKRQFAGDSQLKQVLFSFYVKGPAVAAAYREAVKQ